HHFTLFAPRRHDGKLVVTPLTPEDVNGHRPSPFPLRPRAPSPSQEPASPHFALAFENVAVNLILKLWAHVPKLHTVTEASLDRTGGRPRSPVPNRCPKHDPTLQRFGTPRKLH